MKSTEVEGQDMLAWCLEVKCILKAANACQNPMHDVIGEGECIIMPIFPCQLFSTCKHRVKKLDTQPGLRNCQAASNQLASDNISFFTIAGETESTLNCASASYLYTFIPLTF